MSNETLGIREFAFIYGRLALLFIVSLLFTQAATADIYSDLIDSANPALGDALVALKQPFTGAVAQTIHAKFAQYLTVEDFGAVGNGTTNDTTAFQNALNAAAPNGTVYLSKSGRYYIASNLTVPEGVTLKGAGFVAGANGLYDSSYFNSRGSVILLSSSATIYMYASSSLSDMYIFRYGITFPAANSAAFAGTCINIDATGVAAKCDVILKNLLIIGFNQAVYGKQCPRLVADNVCLDCISGFYVENTGDPIRFDKCHAWPYATVAYTPYTPSQVRRSGIAYRFTTAADAGKVSNCFAFGYATGFSVENTNGLHLTNCGADDEASGLPLTSVGFSITGASDHVAMFDCQSVAHQSALNVNLSSNTQTINVTGCLLGYTPSNSAVNLTAGGLNITSCIFYYADRAIAIADASARLNMSNCYAQSNIAAEVVANFGNSPYVQINSDNHFQDVGTVPAFNGGGGIPSVASATTVNLPKSSETILITGNTNMFYLAGGWPGRHVTLLFSGTPILSDTAPMQMAGNFSAAPNKTISFVFTSASQCYEVARSNN